MPPYIVTIILLSGDRAFDVELQSEGEWNTLKQAVRSKGFITLFKWRINTNPPSPGAGPFIEDNDLVIPAEAVYFGIGDLSF